MATEKLNKFDAAAFAIFNYFIDVILTGNIGHVVKAIGNRA